MINRILKKILDENRVDRDFSKDVREGYRNPLQDVINNYFDEKPNYLYGGSLAKGTANKDSCDIDLLCYFSSDINMTVESIFKTIVQALQKLNYSIIVKNSAICVLGQLGEPSWDTSVDVVPGKYTSNDNNEDVFIWCNKDKKRLKSNPEIQINKVKESEHKDLIRLIKIYKKNLGFKFKSFYLEIFTIDFISNFFRSSFSLYDKLITFCEHYEDIGNVSLSDPANSDNDISNIHDKTEFDIIKIKIKELYLALLTNDEDTIINAFLNKPYNLDTGYLKNAKKHSPELFVSNSLILYSRITLIGKYKKDGNWNQFCSSDILLKDTNLIFEIYIPQSIPVERVELIVTNSGYDAEIRNNCPRGKPEKTDKEICNYSYKYSRPETTKYLGNHFVQALITTKSHHKFYSDILTVRVRDNYFDN